MDVPKGRLSDVEFVRKMAQMNDVEWWNHIKGRPTMTQTLGCYGWKGDKQSEENVKNGQGNKSKASDKSEEPEYIRKRKINKLVAKERKNIVKLVEDRIPMRITKKQERRKYAQERAKSKQKAGKKEKEETINKTYKLLLSLQVKEIAKHKQRKKEELNMQTHLYEFNSSVILNEMKIENRHKNDNEVITIQHYELNEEERKKALEIHLAEVEKNKPFYKKIKEDFERNYELQERKFAQQTNAENSISNLTLGVKRKKQNKNKQQVCENNTELLQAKSDIEEIVNDNVQKPDEIIAITSKQKKEKKSLKRRSELQKKVNKNDVKSVLETASITNSKTLNYKVDECSDFIIKNKNSDTDVGNIKSEPATNKKSECMTDINFEIYTNISQEHHVFNNIKAKQSKSIELIEIDSETENEPYFELKQTDFNNDFKISVLGQSVNNISKHSTKIELIEIDSESEQDDNSETKTKDSKLNIKIQTENQSYIASNHGFTTDFLQEFGIKKEEWESIPQSNTDMNSYKSTANLLQELGFKNEESGSIPQSNTDMNSYKGTANLLQEFGIKKEESESIPQSNTDMNSYKSTANLLQELGFKNEESGSIPQSNSDMNSYKGTANLLQELGYKNEESGSSHQSNTDMNSNKGTTNLLQEFGIKNEESDTIETENISRLTSEEATIDTGLCSNMSVIQQSVFKVDNLTCNNDDGFEEQEYQQSIIQIINWLDNDVQENIRSSEIDKEYISLQHLWY